MDARSFVSLGWTVLVDSNGNVKHVYEQSGNFYEREVVKGTADTRDLSIKMAGRHWMLKASESVRSAHGGYARFLRSYVSGGFISLPEWNYGDMYGNEVPKLHLPDYSYQLYVRDNNSVSRTNYASEYSDFALVDGGLLSLDEAMLYCDTRAAHFLVKKFSEAFIDMSAKVACLTVKAGKCAFPCNAATGRRTDIAVKIPRPSHPSPSEVAKRREFLGLPNNDAKPVGSGSKKVPKSLKS